MIKKACFLALAMVCLVLLTFSEETQKSAFSPSLQYNIMVRATRLETPKKLDDLYHSLNPADLKRRVDQKLKKLYTHYEKKRKGPVQVNPYKKLNPSSVSFSVMQ